MYTEELTNCPFCLTPLNGNENTCPSCNANLKEAKQTGEHIGSSNYTDTPNINNKYYENFAAQNSNNYTANSSNSSQNANYNINLNNSAPQTPYTAANTQASGHTTAANAKKNVRSILIIIIISIILITISVGIAFINMLGSSSFSDTIIINEIDKGPQLTGSTTAQEIESHYATAEVIHLQKPAWVNTSAEFSLAPDEDGERQYHEVSSDSSMIRGHFSGNAVVYFENTADYIGSHENRLSSFYYFETANDTADFSITCIVDNYHDYTDIHNYLLSIDDYSQEYTFTFEEVFDFGGGLTGYGIYEEHDGRGDYYIYVPITVEGSNVIDVLTIRTDYYTAYFDENDEFVMEYDFNIALDELSKRFYLEIQTEESGSATSGTTSNDSDDASQESGDTADVDSAGSDSTAEDQDINILPSGPKK